MGLFDVQANVDDQFDPNGTYGGGGTPAPPPTPVPSGPGGTGIVPNPTGPYGSGTVGHPGGIPTPVPAASGPGGVPTFNYNAPQFPGLPPVPQFTPLPFNAPDPKAIANDPGYQFRLSQGLASLQASQAAKGIARTGGSLEDFINYGQSSASQEYQNMYQRAIDTYNVQEGAQKDKFAPQLAGWQANANIALPAWEFPITDERTREQMILDAWSRAVSGLQQ